MWYVYACDMCMCMHMHVVCMCVWCMYVYKYGCGVCVYHIKMNPLNSTQPAKKMPWHSGSRAGSAAGLSWRLAFSTEKEIRGCQRGVREAGKAGNRLFSMSVSKCE